jgi:hypothetical protein
MEEEPQSMPVNPAESAGTLTIEDLLNAQGVGNPVGTGLLPTGVDDEGGPGAKKPDEDDGG